MRDDVFLLDFWGGSNALFGLWLPCCLLLVDVHHLEGNLKGSRLSPEGWRTDIWDDDNTWRVGFAGNTMMVLDLCKELRGGNDPLAKLGRSQMNEVLQEFCDIMGGKIVDLERMDRNLLMRFLSVDSSACLSELWS